MKKNMLNTKICVTEERILLENDKIIFNSINKKVENVKQKETKEKLIKRLMVWKESIKKREYSLQLIENHFNKFLVKTKDE